MTTRIRQIFKNMTVRKKTNIKKRLNREIKKMKKYYLNGIVTVNS
jgi:hypothetical protein